MPLLPLTGAAIKGIFKSGLKYDLNPYKHNLGDFEKSTKVQVGDLLKKYPSATRGFIKKVPKCN